EKLSGGRGRKRAMQAAQRQSGQKTNRIEMAGMIGDQDERTITAQMFLPDNLEAAPGAEQTANDQRDKRADSVDKHVGLARKIPEPLDQSLVEIGGRLVLPALHRSL